MGEMLDRILALFRKQELGEIDLSLNTNVCMLPFVHFHVTQHGNVTPCCQAPWDEPLAAIADGSILDIWNANSFLKIRMEMLKGNKPPVCRRCYEKEESGWTSLRQVSNSKYAHHVDLLKQAFEEQGTVKVKPVYFDIRFSNVCNLKCRICGPWASSKWFEDAFEMGMADRKNQTIERPVQDTKQLLVQIEELIDGVEEFYFAGGEPLMMEEHYAILDLLIRKGKTDVQLTYNTNFSTLKYKGQNILDLWNQFSKIDVALSLDGYGERLEYMRNPIKWPTVLGNLQQLKKVCPNVNITISPTVSVFNVLHLPEFHRKLVNEKWVPVEGLIPTVLIDPSYYSIRILPVHLQKKADEIYQEHLKWIVLQPHSDNQKYGHMVKQFESILTHLASKKGEDQLPVFKQKIEQLDGIRSENFKSVFPELAELVH